MGIHPSSKAPSNTPEMAKKRTSIQDTVAGLKPLKPGGTVGFSGFRDPGARSTSTSSVKANSPDDAMDSDEDEDAGGKTPVRTEDLETKETSNSTLSVEDAKRQDEVAEGVQKIRVRLRSLKELLSCYQTLMAVPAETTTFGRAS